MNSLLESCVVNIKRKRFLKQLSCYFLISIFSIQVPLTHRADWPLYSVFRWPYSAQEEMSRTSLDTGEFLKYSAGISHQVNSHHIGEGFPAQWTLGDRRGALGTGNNVATG